VTRLCEGTGPNANNALAAGVLATVGELAKVVSLPLFLYVVMFDPFSHG
jgi:FKBP12-rapamycin complex-associated protein